MVVKTFKDLRDLIENRVDRRVKAEDVENIFNAIYYDPNRPSLGENWRSYVDSLPFNLTDLIYR